MAIAARFLSALIVACIWAGAALAEKRVALIVGNSQYVSDKLKLKNPANDAHNLAEALKDIGFEVILRIDVGKGEFDHALADFARKATDADAALFYYAGHGLQSNGQNYFLPTDVEIQDRVDAVDVEYRAVDQGHIMRALDRVDREKGVKIIILDACRDNPLARQIFYAERSLGGVGPGLARIDSAQQTFIAYATIHDHVADDGEGRNSPFAAALIKHIKTPGLEIASLFQRVTNEVYKQTSGKQQPEISSSLHNPFYLNPGESDSEAWNKVRESTNPADFKEFIRKFPDSPFAREAQFRIDLFDRIRRENEEARQEAERRQREADRLREEELKRQEAERLAREAEKKHAEELKRQEAERLAREAEKKHAEELKRQEAERLAREAEKKHAEELKRREAELRAREAELKSLEAEHLAREAEKKHEEELKREAAERLAREAELKKQDADRLTREAEKKHQDELKRQEAERLAREAELKMQEAESLAREAAKKHEEELKQQEAELRLIEAEKKRQEEEARKKAEREREEERLRLAALEQEEHKKQLEREQQEQARTCESDQRKLDELVSGLRTGEIEQLGKNTACRSLQPAVAAARKKLASAVKQACENDRKALDSLKDGDVESLKAAVAGMRCDSERVKGEDRIAKLEYESKRMQAICADETAKFRAIDDSTPRSREALAGFFQSACLPLREEAKSLDKKIESRLNEAQKQLMRLGCYAGAITGKFDTATAKSLSLYLTRKGSKEPGGHLSDGLLSELTNQERTVCVEPVIATPAPEPMPPANKQAIQEEEARPEPRRHKLEKALREEEAPPARPQKHRKQVAAHEEEEAAPSPRERHKPHRAAREEQPAPVRHHKVEAAARPHRAAKVWQPPAFVGPSASHASPSVIGVGN